MNAKFLAITLAACSLASPLRAENARLPYGPVYRMEKIQAELSQTYSNLVVVLRMTPATAGVKPTDVHVFLDCKSGRLPVKIGADGDFSVPINDALVAEQPWIVTDQPKGTMKLDWGLALAVDRVTNPTRYARLMKAVKDCSFVEERMREVLPNTDKISITGLKITFPDDAPNAFATVHAKDGDHKIAASAARQILIPLKPGWLAEDPEVTFSSPPLRQELSSENL